MNSVTHWRRQKKIGGRQNDGQLSRRVAVRMQDRH